MYKIVLLLCFAFACCGQNKTTTATNIPTQYYSYSPRHDADFINGNPAFAATVLQIWKGYEAGGFASYKKYFADTVHLIFTNEPISGPSASVLKAWEQSRKKVTTTQCHVDFWQPVFMKDVNQQWVLLWGKHEGITIGNNRDSWSVHQVWKFNAEGKIFFMQEYRSRFYW